MKTYEIEEKQEAPEYRLYEIIQEGELTSKRLIGVFNHKSDAEFHKQIREGNFKGSKLNF